MKLKIKKKNSITIINCNDINKITIITKLGKIIIIIIIIIMIKNKMKKNK